MPQKIDVLQEIPRRHLLGNKDLLITPSTPGYDINARTIRLTMPADWYTYRAIRFGGSAVREWILKSETDVSTDHNATLFPVYMRKYIRSKMDPTVIGPNNRYFASPVYGFIEGNQHIVSQCNPTIEVTSTTQTLVEDLFDSFSAINPNAAKRMERRVYNRKTPDGFAFDTLFSVIKNVRCGGTFAPFGEAIPWIMTEHEDDPVAGIPSVLPRIDPADVITTRLAHSGKISRRMFLSLFCDKHTTFQTLEVPKPLHLRNLSVDMFGTPIPMDIVLACWNMPLTDFTVVMTGDGILMDSDANHIFMFDRKILSSLGCDLEAELCEFLEHAAPHYVSSIHDVPSHDLAAMTLRIDRTAAEEIFISVIDPDGRLVHICYAPLHLLAAVSDGATIPGKHVPQIDFY